MQHQLKNRANKSVLRAATFVIMVFKMVFLPDLASPQGGAGSATALLRPGRERVHTREALLRSGRGRVNTITALLQRSCRRVTSSALLRQCRGRVKTSSGSAVAGRYRKRGSRARPQRHCAQYSAPGAHGGGISARAAQGQRLVPQAPLRSLD